jgi:hypothetical protein
MCRNSVVDMVVLDESAQHHCQEDVESPMRQLYACLHFVDEKSGTERTGHQPELGNHEIGVLSLQAQE